MKNISSPTLHCFLTSTRFLLALFFSLCFFNQATLFGQQTRCNTFTYEETLLQEPEYAQRKIQVEAAMLESAKNKYHSKSMNSGPYTIPVAIHVVHSTGDAYGQASNIHDSDIFDAIQFLNQAFSTALDPLTNQYEQMDISFCLAEITRNGSNTYTDLYRPDEDDPGNQNASIKSHFGTISAFPRTDFMNVWVVRSICQGPNPNNCSLIGYSTLAPAHGSWFDGIVIEYAHLGNMAFVHEVGHYLNLLHTFGNSDEFADCTNNDCLLDNDKVCDTRPDGSLHTCSETNHCHTDTDSGPFTTDENDPVGNIMDYGNLTCEEYFTVGQRDRMYAAILYSRNTLLKNAGACCLPPEGPMVASFSYTIDIGNNQITVNANESTSGTASIIGYEWDINGTIYNLSSSGSHTFTLPNDNFVNVCLKISSNVPNCHDTYCQSVCLGTGIGCNYVCNSDFQSPSQSLSGGFYLGVVPGWVCETPSPDYSDIGLPGTPVNTGSAFMLKSAGLATEAVRAMTGELPSNKNYIFSMYKSTDNPICGTKTRVLIDRNNSILSFPCQVGGLGAVYDSGNPLSIFEDDEIELETKFTRYIVCFEIPENEDGYHDVIIFPFEKPAACVLGRLRVTRVELFEDTFIDLEDITMPCPGEVQLGADLSCSLTDVFYKWEKETSPGIWSTVVDYLTSPVYTLNVDETTKFRLTREFMDIYGDIVSPKCNNLITQTEITVTINEKKPDPAFTHSLDYCTNTVSFTSHDPEGSHSWVFHDPVNPGTAQSANPVFTFSDLGDFLVTHTVSNTCGTWTYTTSVQVTCIDCDCPPGIYIESMGLIDLLPPNSYVLPATPTAPVNLYINTELVIDYPVPYTAFSYSFPPGSTICMGENAKITVKNGSSLKLDGVTVKGCDMLWDQILIEGGGKLYVQNGSTITDGLWGLVAEPGSQFFSNATTYDRNFIGITIKMGGIANAGIIGNTFNCTKPLLPTSYVAPNGGLVPTPGQTAWAGIFTMHNVHLAPRNNEFLNLSAGIRSYGPGSLIVRLSSFRDILSNNEYNKTGVGVIATPPVGWYARLIVDGFGNGATVPSSFHNCEVGIFGERVTMSINNNKMTHMLNTGILGQVMQSRSIGIVNNFIESRWHGVNIIEAPGAHHLIIRNNTIQIGLDGTGIWLKNVSPVNNSYLLSGIRANTLNMAGGNLFGGITLANSNNILLKLNQINLSASDNRLYGIRLDNCTQNDIECNTILGSGTTTNQSVGIMASTSTENTFSCNTNFQNRAGVQFNNICDGTQVRGNIFNANRIGLQYSNLGMTQTGPQDWRGNSWDASLLGVEFQAGGIGDQNDSRYTIQPPMTQPLWPANASSYPDWFIPQNPPSQNEVFECPANLNTCDIEGFAPGPCDEVSFLTFVADGMVNGEAYQGGIKWHTDRYLYRRLKEDCQGLPDEESRFADFLVAGDTSNIGRYYAIRKSTSDLNFLQPSDYQAYVEFETKSGLFEAEIDDIDSMLMAGTESEIPGLMGQRGLVLQAMEDQAGPYQVLVNNIHAQRAIMADSLWTANDAIAAVYPYEVNEKTVNKIYLKTLAVGLSEFDSSQLVQLQAVAEQCPLSGGDVVYWARAILDIVGIQDYDDGAICQGMQGLENGGTQYQKVPVLDELLVYPNPAKSEIHLRFQPSETESLLVVTDLYGREAVRRTLPGQVSSYTLDTHHLPGGIYIVSIHFSKERSLSKGVVIAN